MLKKFKTLSLVSFGLFVSFSYLHLSGYCFAATTEVDPYVARKTMVFLERGNNYYHQQRFQRALKEYKTALKIHPENKDALFNLANTYVSLAEVDLAIETYNQLLVLDPDDAMAYNNLGNVYEGVGDYAEAENHYKKALDVFPDFAPALSNLGSFYLSQNRLDEALVMYERVVKVEPDKIYGWNNLGNLAYTKKDYNTAIKHYAKALEINPEESFLWLNKANAYIKKNKLDFALQSLDKAYKFDRKSPTITEAIADVNFMKSNFEKAAEFYKITLSRLDTPTPDLYYKLGKTYANLDKEEAVVFYNQYLAYSSDQDVMEEVSNTVARLEREVAEEKAARAKQNLLSFS